MIVKPIEIQWHPKLSIFAYEPFLKAVSDDYGWVGGFSASNELRCILPFTIIKKMIFRMIRFRVETIPIVEGFSVDEEKTFLTSAITYFRKIGIDVIIPATTNSIFRTYPDGAIAAPYGSYIIDLRQPDDVLWRNIDRITRQNINTAKKNGVSIRSGIDLIADAYPLIVETFKRSKLPFMSFEAFKRYVMGLGDYGKIMIADYNGVAQSYVVFAFSDHCAYAVYAGNSAQQQPGANKLLYWEAICFFKNLGIAQYDFVGARINPEKGSKQETINALKRRFGAELKQGYMWKYAINPLKYHLYCLAARLRSGGDIVDAEKHKMKQYVHSNHQQSESANTL